MIRISNDTLKILADLGCFESEKARSRYGLLKYFSIPKYPTGSYMRIDYESSTDTFDVRIISGRWNF
jgi:hypothetical protein